MANNNLRNWAGNYVYSAANVRYPESVVELQGVVRAATSARALGTRHSFNGIADTETELISTSSLNRVLSVDRDEMAVTVEGGITYGKLAEYLHEQGFALHNLASLPHISVAGACATATHGSGDGNGNLSTAVKGMEIVVADGSLIRVPDEDLAGAVVNLGCLGVVARLTLAIEPTYEVQQYVYDNLPVSELDKHFDAITSSAYSVSLFNDWQTDSINQLWLKHRSPFKAPGEFYGATLAPVKRHPLILNSAENCTEQLGIAGPWHERLPHFRMDFTPSNGEELQSEYFVPRRHALAAIHAIYELKDQLSPLLYISEIRTIAADDLWMSPAYRQDSVGIHFTWKQNWLEVSKLLPEVERRLEPFGAKPHWGKLFKMPFERVRSRYERLPDFRRLVARYDPEGKFRNQFANELLS